MYGDIRSSAPATFSWVRSSISNSTRAMYTYDGMDNPWSHWSKAVPSSVYASGFRRYPVDNKVPEFECPSKDKDLLLVKLSFTSQAISVVPHI